MFHNQLDDQRNYPAARLFCCHRLFSSDKIVQCTLHRPVYIAVLFQVFLQCTQDIFVYSDIGMVYSGICIDLENKYILDSVHCNIVSGFLLATHETVYSAYLQCTLVWCTQHIYSVLLYGISVHPNIYQGFLLVNDKTVHSAIF